MKGRKVLTERWPRHPATLLQDRHLPGKMGRCLVKKILMRWKLRRSRQGGAKVLLIQQLKLKASRAKRNWGGDPKEGDLGRDGSVAHLTAEAQERYVPHQDQEVGVDLLTEGGASLETNGDTEEEMEGGLNRDATAGREKGVEVDQREALPETDITQEEGLRRSLLMKKISEATAREMRTMSEQGENAW